MTKDEIIDHLAAVASSVFAAEDVVKAEWYPRLEAAKHAPQEERDATCTGFLRAIAAQMLRSYSEADLHRLYPDEETDNQSNNPN